MRLSFIEARGLYQHHDVDCILGPITVFAGPNGAGKSTALGVPRLVINGPAGAIFFPLLGASPTYPWSASCTFDDGTRIDRGMGVTTGHRAAINLNTAGLREIQTRILAKVGRAGSWSVSELLAMTPQKQADFLRAEVLGSSGWTPEQALEAVHAAQDEDLSKYASGLRCPGTTILALTLQRARDRHKDLDSTAKRLLQVCAQDVREEAQERAPAGTVAAWRQRREELLKVRDELQAQRGAAEANDQARAILEQAVNAAAQKLERLRTTNWTAVAAAKRERLDAATTQLTAAQQDHRLALKELAAAQARSATAATAVQEATDAVERSRTLREQLVTLYAEANPEHPAVAVLDALVTAVDVVADPPDELIVARERAKAELRRIATTSSSAVEAASAVLDQDTARLRGLTTQAAAATRAVEAARRTEESARRTLAEREAEANARKGDVDRYAVEAAAADQTQNEVQAELDSARDRMQAIGESVNETLGEQIAAQMDMIKEVDANITRLNELGVARARRLERRTELQRSQQSRTQTRASIQALETAMARSMEAAVEPFVSPVSRITERVIGATFEMTLDGGGAQFWLRFPTHRAPLEASRSEYVVAMMALRVAVQAKLGGWRHLIVDDFENLQRTRRDAFLIAMQEEIQAGNLDNVLVGLVDEDHAYRPPAGAHLIAMERRS